MKRIIFTTTASLLIFSYGLTQPATGLDFDGTNDYVSCGNILPPSYTKEAWINISDLSANNNIISGGVGGQHAFWAPGLFSSQLSAGHNLTYNQVNDPVSLLINTWYHVAVTYDAATTTMKLYKNGVLVSTNTAVACLYRWKRCKYWRLTPRLQLFSLVLLMKSEYGTGLFARMKYRVI